MKSNIYIPRKIDFIGIGTVKAGTSALYNYLQQHPDLSMASRKEIHFFDNEDIFSNPFTYQGFESFFDFNSGKKMYGEITPAYILHKPAMKRIWEYNPKIKLIAILRDPAHMVFSNWNMAARRNFEKEDFSIAIKRTTPPAIKKTTPPRLYMDYVEYGFYSQQLNRIFKYFPKEQVLFIKYEHYKDNQEKTLNQIFEFLNVSKENYQFKPKKVFTLPYSTKISKSDREFLVNLYIEDIKRVESMLGWNCNDWKI